MSKAAWAAIMTAIAFPTIALVVVILARPEPPRPPRLPAPQQEQAPRHAPPGPVPGVPGEMIVRMKGQLGLTDEQVDTIWSIVEPAHRRQVEIQSQVEQREAHMRELLEADDPDEQAVESLIEEITGLHAERAKLDVLTPLRVRKVLTPDQRAKLVEIWSGPRDAPPGPPPGPHPARKVGPVPPPAPPPGKQPPGAGGPPPPPPGPGPVPGHGKMPPFPPPPQGP